MKKVYLNAIRRAKELLTNNTFDAYHTLDHHVEVVHNIYYIVKLEKIKPDIQLLEIAAWWHDVYKDSPNEDELLTKELFSLNLDNNEIQKILDIISGHSFGQKQQSVEAQLLYDADKIALVSVSRWKYAFNQFDSGLISIEERDRYIPEWNRRMLVLEDKLNFYYSKHIFRQRRAEFIEWLKSISRYKNDLLI